MSMIQSLTQLVRTWWQQDRIRTNRMCGQLLALNVGDRLLIDETIYSVMGRWTDQAEPDATPTRVEYCLRDELDDGRLERLAVPIDQREAILIYRDELECELHSEQIVILPGKPPNHNPTR